MRLFNEGWEFAKNEPEGFAPVDIPHDWLIRDTNNLYETGVGWYRKVFKPEFADGMRVFLRFDGVHMDCELFVNGKSAGRWAYGYTAFEFDITELLHKDGNTLLLRVNHQAPNSRWYTGAGIYRDVFLKVKNPARFVSDGIYITPRKQDDGTWKIKAEAEVCAGGLQYEIRHGVLETDGGLVIDNPKLWDTESPFLYHLKSELLVDGKVTDTEITRFGLREIEFTPDKGFFLNGRRVKLNGVCQHHDLGALGAAVHKDAVRRQLLILRGMGVNAVRTAHNPPAAVLMELADEMGFLVMSEILDMWKLPKNKYDYARFFDEWIERDVASWIRRDRNCPSVILWSVGNEIYDTHADPVTGAATLRFLKDLVEKHDPGGHAPVTFSSNYMPWENTQKCADVVKIIGYNYAEKLYEPHHAEHPDWIIYGGETGSIVFSRGIYHFPLGKDMLSDDDLQCSALGNSRTSWGARSVEACITDDRDATFSPGQFLWSGFDYIGEPTPYHTKNSYFGQVDTAGFPKDSYYIFKSAWTDCKTEPFIHIFPYWDFSPGQIIDVRVCTNAPKLELFLNGKTLGVTEIDHKNGKKIVADYRVPYEPGALTATAYDEDGREAARAERRSFGDVYNLTVKREKIGDLAFCGISAADRDGNPVENANNRVIVQVAGGVLLGTDNGDSTDYDQYHSPSRRLFSGKLLAIAKPADDSFNIEARIDLSDIPIRKIELTADGYRVTARTYPENATYGDLVWRLTDSGGIDSPLGTLEAPDGGKSALVLPRGDGEVYVRCGAKNGREHINLYTQIPITITGCGKPLLNPYAFLSGGLYNRSNAELTSGNERGVATLRDGVSHVGFADVDFGSFGADEITLSLFPLGKEPFTFEVWEGMPGQGGELVCPLYYGKGSVWNTYQDVTYRLPRRLRGVTAICFVFNEKVHIKGFVFAKAIKAYTKLYAADNDMLYGDSYIVNGRSIERIGNNVTIVYNDMDFGPNGAGAVNISCRSARKNSFQIVFTDENGTTVSTMLETDASPEYAAARFPLSHWIMGLQTVSLVFLPGCEIDIDWIRFG
ncbi:MAG: DUF4982 domain-containing protein [Defluviitaleaceae bacterium]|nr:DUF4982 domain-containing protein [Defluviitaleaceae bacterium]MCL2836911.1 DUF4982 domain-containing protein [Defluviitaleaceae bacterium]